MKIKERLRDSARIPQLNDEFRQNFDSRKGRILLTAASMPCRPM